MNSLTPPPRWISGIIWISFGLGLARVAPIFLGIALSHQYSLEVYANYVSFIVAVNLTCAIPLLGTTQLILSETENRSPRLIIKKFLVPTLKLHLLCCSLTSLLTVSHFPDLHNIQKNFYLLIALYLFSLGYCLTGMAAAGFNRTGKQKKAGICWVSSTKISGLLALCAIIFDFQVDEVYLIMAIGWLLGGVTVVLYASKEKEKSNNLFVAQVSVPRARIGQIIKLGAPSVLYLIGFYLLNQLALRSTESTLKGSFSLGFQLFSSALFIPSVLGNVVTPRLMALKSQPKLFMSFTTYILLVYSLIAIAWMAAIYLALPVLLEIFQLPNTVATKEVIIILQLAAVAAIILALLNQIMLADLLSHHITIAATIWLTLPIIGFFSNGGGADRAAIALNFAYMLALIYSAIAWRRTRSTHRGTH